MEGSILSRGIYGTEITEFGHCLGVGNEGRGKSQKISVIELILMPFTQKVAYRSWKNFGREKIKGTDWICCTYKKSNWRYILIIDI